MQEPPRDDEIVGSAEIEAGELGEAREPIADGIAVQNQRGRRVVDALVAIAVGRDGAEDLLGAAVAAQRRQVPVGEQSRNVLGLREQRQRTQRPEIDQARSAVANREIERACRYDAAASPSSIADPTATTLPVGSASGVRGSRATRCWSTTVSTTGSLAVDPRARSAASRSVAAAVPFHAAQAIR